jgi:malate dehydrogenase (quinone)
MIPSYGQTLNDNPALLDEIRQNTATVLNNN